MNFQTTTTAKNPHCFLRVNFMRLLAQDELAMQWLNDKTKQPMSFDFAQAFDKQTPIPYQLYEPTTAEE